MAPLIKTQSFTIDSAASKHLTFRALILCGETQARTGLENLPQQLESWHALRALAENILDPVIDHFGPIELTFGFCSPTLFKEIPRGTSPKDDQHHAHEIKASGNPFCKRHGAAVDFRAPGEDSIKLATWVAVHLPFDRIYVYGKDRPIHVSYGPDHAQKVTLMVPDQKRPGRLRPTTWNRDTFVFSTWEKIESSFQK